MSIDLNPLVHPDYRLWESDLARWRQDLAAWQAELAGVVTDLERAAAALEDHRKALASHGDQLREERDALAETGVAAGGPEQGEPLAGTVRPAGPFAEWAARHPRLWDAHERLKRHHHGIVAKTALLLKAVAEPM